MTDQHPRIRRPVGRMATGTSFDERRHVLECEGAPFIAMTAEAGRFVRVRAQHLKVTRASVGSVTIDALSYALIERMGERLAERGAFPRMTAGAEFVRRRAQQFAGFPRIMDRMTIDTADRGALVRIEEAIRVRAFLRMAVQTPPGFHQRIPDSEAVDQVGIHCLGVVFARTVTVFTPGVRHPVYFKYLIYMGISLEVNAAVLMAQRTEFRTRIS